MAEEGAPPPKQMSLAEALKEGAKGPGGSITDV
jgi:hypothetical protein